MKKDETCEIPVDQEVVTIEENGKPPMEVIHEGPTQPEERVQFDDELKETEEKAEEDDESEAAKPEKSGSFALKSKSYMRAALQEAQKAFDEGEVPIGAVIVKDNTVIARSHNQKEKLKDPTAHAEIMAIREATKKLDNWRLEDCSIYITVEPCPMCLGAILQSKIKKIYYGVHEPTFGSIESNKNFTELSLSKDFEIYSGFLEEDSRKLMKEFFNKHRE